MIPADRSRQNCRCGDGESIQILSPHHGEGNGDENPEGPPGGTRGKGKAGSHQKEESRQQRSHQRACPNHTAHIASDIQILLAADSRQRPGQAQDHDCRYHSPDAGSECAAEIFKGEHPPGQIEDKDKHQSKKGAKYQTQRRVTPGKGLHNTLAFQNSACVEHSSHTQNDQHKNRHSQVCDLSSSSGFDCFPFHGLFPAGFQKFLLISLHRCKIKVI